MFIRRLDILRSCILLWAFVASFSGLASVKQGFEALRIYDYFLAKKIFYKCNKKKYDAAACYGLAVIYSRNDNPFFQTDSAAKYAALSYNYFNVKPVQNKFGDFLIDTSSIRSLCDSIALKNLKASKKQNTIGAYNHFLTFNYLASAYILNEAVYMRDELEFNNTLLAGKSDSTWLFMNTHPQSPFYKEASLLRQRQVYDEQTVQGNDASFIKFIERHPESVMINSAYENLFRIYSKNSDVSGLKNFVTLFPASPQYNEAWKLLFALSVKSFSNEELEKFLATYPAFPFRNSIVKELELNKKSLIPYQKGDFFGFIDSTARLVLPAQYESAGPFREGLSVVSRNDSVFYINKEGVNVFNQFYTEALPFKGVLAAARKGGRWAFINRQGQIVGNMYDEINELSEDIYIVKINGKYGAVGVSGQLIIEPRFQKMGDFKNGFAYYAEENRYGFVSKTGHVSKAEFQWISDFNEQQVAIIKQNNLYGLINSAGEIILQPQFELIQKATGNIFMLIKEAQYGFYSGTGCYITQVMYDFVKEKPVEFYTNGTIFKLLRKNEQALADANGRISIDFGVYDEVGFANSGLIKVKRKNKYGYADRKLSMVIPYKYSEAEDFSDSTSIVKLKDKNLIINCSGKELFSSDFKIERLSFGLFLLGEEGTQILNRKGEIVIKDVANIQAAGHQKWIITLDNGEIKLLTD